MTSNEYTRPSTSIMLDFSSQIVPKQMHPIENFWPPKSLHGGSTNRKLRCENLRRGILRLQFSTIDPFWFPCLERTGRAKKARLASIMKRKRKVSSIVDIFRILPLSTIQRVVVHARFLSDVTYAIVREISIPSLNRNATRKHEFHDLRWLKPRQMLPSVFWHNTHFKCWEFFSINHRLSRGHTKSKDITDKPPPPRLTPPPFVNALEE
jgi:hypothetical protein